MFFPNFREGMTSSYYRRASGSSTGVRIWESTENYLTNNSREWKLAKTLHWSSTKYNICWSFFTFLLLSCNARFMICHLMWRLRELHRWNSIRCYFIFKGENVNDFFDDDNKEPVPCRLTIALCLGWRLKRFAISRWVKYNLPGCWWRWW